MSLLIDFQTIYHWKRTKLSSNSLNADLLFTNLSINFNSQLWHVKFSPKFWPDGDFCESVPQEWLEYNTYVYTTDCLTVWPVPTIVWYSICLTVLFAGKNKDMLDDKANLDEAFVIPNSLTGLFLDTILLLFLTNTAS